jgi:hypothetical protein
MNRNRCSAFGRAKIWATPRENSRGVIASKAKQSSARFVIPGCALLGADPESSTMHCSGFRVRAKTRAPE